MNIWIEVDILKDGGMGQQDFQQGHAKSCMWDQLTPYSDPGWGLPGRRPWLERDWDS